MVHVTPGITEKVSKRKQSVLAFLSVTTVSYHKWGDTHYWGPDVELGHMTSHAHRAASNVEPPQIIQRSRFIKIDVASLTHLKFNHCQL